MNPERKYRMTYQRQVILEELKKIDSHPTADKIYDRVRKRLPKISMGTVYRNLDVLASCGFIKKLEPDHSQMRFDPNTHEHFHITCTECGRIDDALIEPLQNTLDSLESSLGNLTKYGIFGHKLEFIGLCSRCQENMSETWDNDDPMHPNFKEEER